MKNAVVFFLMIFFVCEVHAQSVGGGGSGGGGLRKEPNALRRGGCVEGRRTLFYETRNGDRQVAVFRQCQNGSYYDLSDYVYNPSVRCTEGRRELWSIRDTVNDSVKSVIHICQKGKWVPAEPKRGKITWPWSKGR